MSRLTFASFLVLLVGLSLTHAGAARLPPSPRRALPSLKRPDAASAPAPPAAAPLAVSLSRLRGGSGGVSFAGAPPFVLMCAGFAALDALLLGYDIGVVSGILVFVQEQFGLSTHQTEIFASAINKAAIGGALASGVIADRFGRKPSLFLSSLAFTTGSFLMALAPTYEALLFGRYIQGFGVGAGLLISPMFISELAPPQFRGSLVTLSEVSLSLGILVAYVANFALSGVAHQWRWMLALGACPGVLLTLRILFLPESPRYLVAKGKTEHARATLRRVVAPRAPPPRAPPRATDDLLIAEREAAARGAAQLAVEAEAEAILAEISERAAAETGSSWAQMSEPATLVAVIVGSIVAFLQHAVGIESLIIYSPLIFAQLGVASKRAAIAGTVGMGLLKLAFESYALLNVDRIGRRPLLLAGSAGLAASLFTMGAAMGHKVRSGTPGVTASSLVVFASIGCYMAFHAISLGPVTWLLLSEIFPSSVRGKAMGIATTINRGTSYVVALTFLSLCEATQWRGAFYLYGGFALFALVFYAALVPETTGMRLEDISPLFGKPRELARRNLASLRGAKAA